MNSSVFADALIITNGATSNSIPYMQKELMEKVKCYPGLHLRGKMRNPQKINKLKTSPLLSVLFFLFAQNNN